MGGIDTGGGGGGKKSVDHEIPLIPFIDLLLCAIMFLLVTAVWNKLARIDANQQQPGKQTQDQPPPEEKVKLVLQIQNDQFVLASTAGERIEIPKKGDNYDMEKLRNKLQERKQLEPNRTDIIVAPEDGVVYDSVVATMDTVVGEGFPDMSLSDGASML